MVVALHHPQRILRHVLARDEPRLVFAPAALCAFFLQAADAQALALAEGMEAQALMLGDHTAALVLDRPRLLRDIAVEELAERPLANEADAGGILLFRVGQSDLLGDAPHFGLAQLAHREQGLR